MPIDESVEPTIAIQAWPIAPPPAGHLEKGLHLVASAVRRDPESPLAALKTTSRADYVYARLEARRAGADDAIFLTIDGHLSEATSANLFIVREAEAGHAVARLRDPARDDPKLDPGVGYGGWPGDQEGWLTTRDLAEADEAFLSSSVAGILPVTRFEGSPIGSGLPGPWTAKARAAREAYLMGGQRDPRRAHRGYRPAHFRG